MTNSSKTTSSLPFSISDLPEGISMKKEILRADPNVKGTVVIQVQGSSDLKITAGRNSHLKVVVLQNADSQTDIEFNITTQADESAQIDLLQFHLGGAKVTGTITQNADKEAEINTDLLCRTKDKQTYQFDIANVYPGKNGRGKMLVKGMALGQSSVTMNGAIQIGRNGGGTNTYLKQDSLLLSKKARIKARPGLNIDTNDVKAGHSASITNLSDESLFYLTSRGMDEETARTMMMNGFVAEQLDKIDDLPELKKTIQTLI